MKNILITGAAGGIGKATALEFAKLGYNIGIHYNTSSSAAQELKKEIIALGADAECFQYDLSEHTACFALANDFLKRFGSIDILVNNAAFSQIADISAISVDDFQKTININLAAPFYIIKALLPSFLKNKNGRIINISSVWGINGSSCEVAYSATKSGLIGLTKALAKELGASGITVNAVAPGYIDTPMNNNVPAETATEIKNDIPVGRLGAPQDVAKAILFLSDDSADYITGQCIAVDGGWI